MSAHTPRATLLIRDGGFDGVKYAIEGEETVIGRNPTTDITLLDEGISREHALVLFDPKTGDYRVEDLQSTNGTLVNAKKIRSQLLAHGDEIEIGSTRFQFLLADEEPPA